LMPIFLLTMILVSVSGPISFPVWVTASSSTCIFLFVILLAFCRNPKKLFLFKTSVFVFLGAVVSPSWTSLKSLRNFSLFGFNLFPNETFSTRVFFSL
ncbi:MAG: uncharacterized protein A8A55_3308, partial [Amphiamblys sp. WSBS2006]